MIRGVVTSRYEAVIPLVVIGARGQREPIEAIVDTGFDGWLSLPQSFVDELELPWQRLGGAFLADGSEIEFDIHDGTVLWDRKLREISIDVSDTDPLVGMRLLEGYQLTLPVQPEHEFTIRQIPRSRNHKTETES